MRELLWADGRNTASWLNAWEDTRYKQGVTWAAALLCAGLGTRLRPLTSLVPKPLVPVGDRPLVDHAVAALTAQGIDDVAINAFHLAEQVERYAAQRRLASLGIRCVVEHELLGTAGGVRGLYTGRDHVLVWNGDIYAPDLDVGAVLAAAGRDWPTLVVASAAGGGTVGLGADGRVVRLRGARFGTETTSVDYIGIAAFPRAFVTALPPRGCLVADGLLPWLAAGKPVGSVPHRGHWSDGGTLARYLEQNRDWLARYPQLARQGSYLGAGAQCAREVHLVRSVLGAGSRVVGAGEVVDSVVWPGALAAAPLRDVVVMSDGTIVAADGTTVAPNVRGGEGAGG